MTTTIPTLLIVAAVALAPQSAAQKTNRPEKSVASTRVPVDVSVQALGDVSGLALGDAVRGGSVSVTPSVGSVSPLAFSCAPSIRDQAAGGCLQASSTPTPGMLFPPPHDGGINNVSSGTNSFVGGGQNNRATGPRSTIGGGLLNTASGYIATVGGGDRNTASGDWVTLGGGRANRASGQFATVGGGYSNIACRNRDTVGGGGRNTASGVYATVGGGYFNTASDFHATVGGGRVNAASARSATVGGGRFNTASGYNATVGGGSNNTASGTRATVGGGRRNTASGIFATVPGGYDNTALGDYSFAAGRDAKANRDGAFVWGDSFFDFFNPSLKTSSANDEFNVYCSGGARFFTNSAATTGVLLAPGGGSWSAVSDRDSKENVEPVDGRAILERVASMPLSTWNYESQDASIRHMGPMAQDFHAAFGLGVSDKLIDTIDPDGVALAAIQGLHALVQERDAVIAKNEAEIEELRERLERLEATLTFE